MKDVISLADLKIEFNPFCFDWSKFCLQSARSLSLSEEKKKCCTVELTKKTRRQSFMMAPHLELNNINFS